MNPLRVYLSSTYEDLKDYRTAVFAALKKAGLEVARMEDYTSADERPLDLCLRDVAQSHIYVGLVAWRYGYEPPAEHGNPLGKSITELEYREAESKKLNKLLFFAHEDTKAHWPDRFKDEVTGAGRRGEKLNAFRKELGTEKTASFFRTPDELATLVLAAIMRSGLSGRRYNVPPRPAAFVPRPNLRKAIVDSLVGAGGGAPAVGTLVQGPGGFGKTTLAIDACHSPDVVNAFPDGILWIELGEKPDLATKLADLHVTATGSRPAVAGVAEVGNALAKALEGCRCLVVVDDAWRTEDLLPFLRLEGSRLLVTTRIRNLVEPAGQTGWPEVPVEEMEGSEAAALLGRGLSLDSPAWDTLNGLAERLGCWPLLLDLANARLLEEQKNRPGDLAECIKRVTQLFERRGVFGFDRRDSKARSAAVENSVAVGLELAEEMCPGLAEKAAEISIFPGDVPVPVRVLADLWAMDEFVVQEEAVRPLDTLSILRWDRRADEVRLHDMIRRALEKRLAQPAALHRKLIDAWGDANHLPHDYAWRWFGWHCVGAEEQERLRGLLLDYRWLQAKLQATSVGALVADYDYASEVPGFAQVQSALKLASHIVATDPEQLASQLFGRLSTEIVPQAKPLLDTVATLDRPWLQPLLPSLCGPGRELIRTVVGGVGELCGVAFVEAGRTLLSVGSEAALLVCDVRTGDKHAVPLRMAGERSTPTTSDVRGGWPLHGPLSLGDIPSGSFPCAMAVAPDGSKVLLGYQWMTLGLVDRKQSTLRGIGTSHQMTLKDVDLDPAGHLAVSGAYDGSVEIRDLATESCTARCLIGSHVNLVRFIQNGKSVLIATDDGLWRWLPTMGPSADRVPAGVTTARGLAATADGRRCVVWGPWKARIDQAQILDLQGRPCRGSPGRRREETMNGEPWPQIIAERAWSDIAAGAINEDGSVVLLALWNGRLVRWDVESDSYTQAATEHAEVVTAVTISPDGKVAATASRDKTIKLWDLTRFTESTNTEQHERTVGVAFSHSGSRALSLARDGTLELWHLESVPPQRLWKRGFADQAWPRRGGGVWCLGTSHDLRYAVLGSLFEVLMCDLETGQEAALICQDGGIRAVAITADSRRVVSMGDDQVLNVVELRIGMPGEARSFKLEFERPLAVTTSDREVMAVTEDGRVRVWNLDSGAKQGHLDLYHDVKDIERPNRPYPLRAADVTDTGHVVALADTSGNVLVRHIFTRLVQHFKTGLDPNLDVLALSVSSNGLSVVTCTADGVVRLWDVETGQTVAAFTADSLPTCCALSPDGRTICVGSASGQMHFLGVRNSQR